MALHMGSEQSETRDDWDAPKGGKLVYAEKPRKGGRRSKTRKDTGEYISQSTIDSPPKGDDDEDEAGGKQKEIFEPSIEDKFNAEQQSADRMFNVEILLTLKPKGGKAVKIPVLADDFRASLVEEATKLAWDSRRLKGVIKAVLDVPDVK